MVLTIDSLTKKYGDKTALDDLSYEFSAGIYGLLGPNGAGKSTLMNIITCNTKATAGSVRVDGEDHRTMGKNYRRLLGFMPQKCEMYPEFTLNRFLYYMAALKGINRKNASVQIDELLRQVNLYDVRGQKLGGFSGGMKQRAMLAQALLGEPEIIILDEPTAGLDPKERISLRNLIAQTAFDKIVIIATHVVQDIEFIAKDVLMLNKGKIAAQGAPFGLCESISGKVFELDIPETAMRDVRAKYKVVNISSTAHGLNVRVISDTEPEYEHRAVTPDLEDLYLYHFGE